MGFFGLRAALLAATAAAVAFFVWDYRRAHHQLAAARLELAGERAARKFEQQARAAAIEEARRRDDRARAAETQIREIRRRPDAHDQAPPLLLDVIGGLRRDAGGVPPGGD